MHKSNGIILYSASDLSNFLDCEHLTTLDRLNLDNPLPVTEDDEEALLLQSRGIAHEKAYLEHLKASVSSFVEITDEEGMDGAMARTRAAMVDGVDMIYQAALADGAFVGHADFLKRVPLPSALGDYGYEVIDTKLSRAAKARYIVQLCFYSGLVAAVQQREPAMMHLVFGDRREEGFRYADYSRYFLTLKRRFVARMAEGAGETYPERCEHCDFCRWRGLCEERWLRDDHLNQVAGVGRSQIRKLRECGIDTLEKLARTEETTRVPGMAAETLLKLHRQAALQLKKRITGENQHELLPVEAERTRGFARLPKPDPGDIFFDLEGDPFEEDGLDYLFGIYYFQGKKPVFAPIWGHTRTEEKAAFELFMDFLAERLRTYPKAHIYHYAGYEQEALKRMMCLHGVREAEVDNLLRMGRLVDLYRIVREAVRLSEPRYSLKNVEHFYLEARTGEVKDAGASVVYYERWKETQDPELLARIADYNCDDVRSTYELRQWLLSLKPAGVPWYEPSGDNETKPADITALTEVEQRLLDYRGLLLADVPEEADEWTDDDALRALTFQLLDFHRRADKPVWWALFARAEMSEEDLIEDVEAIGAMTQDPRRPPRSEKKSFFYTYRYPEQETKLKSGDASVRTDTLTNLSHLLIDEENRVVTFTCSAKHGILPERLSIGSGGPIDSRKLKEALFRFADSLVQADGRYRALNGVLRQESPRIRGTPEGTPIIDASREALPQIIEAVANLDESFLFIQGPPGTGKTHTGSLIIVELLRRGYRVGVSSNSHKAINNLLGAVERAARKKRVSFRGLKKSTDEESRFNGALIHDVSSNKDIIAGGWQLVAGTAWLFADEGMDQALDFLFIDEAGQVALANLIAMGTSARNIVLIGDQMQLGQPIQGVHPGRSGESSLDFLLNGMATIPPDRGIFLDTTWRMHPDVCRFISDAVYDGRLVAHRVNGVQALVLGPDAHAALAPAGIRFLPVRHEGCSQRSEEEANLVADIYGSLLRQQHRDKDGRIGPITGDNILVVAPYNMQVNLLKRTLPEGARVGTVDKFQGQEAEVVIISMATSSGDDLPRHIEFLYSKNRLNVALSRARCLALLVASPDLLAIRCTTVEQMALVNTLCWVRDYADGPDRASTLSHGPPLPSE
jgi:uncharacterized protein